ncbi:MAG TPA: hypothetical protein V6D17_05360 [Candidatus Obscuribacterales bacterium]
MSEFITAKLLIEMLLFAVLGLGIEVVFTALMDIAKDSKKHLMGYSSIWYMPLYALTPIFFAVLAPYLFALPWFVRGLIYVPLFFALEYAGMFSLRKLLGSSPSQQSYYQSRWNVNGLIRLDFAPAFFALGLLLEFVYRFLH